MRIQVNSSCNVCTEEHATGFRSFGKTPKPQITVPAHKLRLSIYEAEQLADDLAQAIGIAKTEAAKQA